MSKTFNDYMKSFAYSVKKHLNAARDFATYVNIMNRPIGIVSKNYNFIRETLLNNIGDNVHEFDGYSTPIGSLADVEYNLQTTPWFLLDEKKNNSTNYLEYVNNTYFQGSQMVNNFDDFDKKLFTNNTVGAIRNYEIYGNRIETNPNGYDDTKLGEVNSRYLDSTLQSADKYYENKPKNSITNYVYDNFGYYGIYGLEEGSNHRINDRVRTQQELIGDIIPWSTSDHLYDSYVVGGGGNGNLNTVRNIFKLDNTTDLHLNYTDDAKNTEINNKYYPFGNFYSLTYSLGLITNSNDKTKTFIAKSLLGYDLLGNEEVDIDFRNQVPSLYKKYYVGDGTRGSNYVDKLSGTDVRFVKYRKSNSNEKEIVRMEFPDIGNDSLWATRTLYTYAELENTKVPDSLGYNSNTWNLGVEYGRHISYNLSVTSEKDDIVHYTNRMFQDGNYKTLISRFHTDEIGKNGARENRDITSTAISQYGMSHGRNLLKLDHKNAKDNGYSNPYCRTWTYHHQYASLKDVIRPFDGLGIGDFKNTGVYAYRTSDGLDKLSRFGAKQSNGLVRITPTNEGGEGYGIRRCMFSIENLAWKGEKDFFKGREDQKGPLGGRIMWFPPYDLKFSENVNVAWSQNQFIGRGESIYTYTNTERGGQLSFKLLIDHPSIVNQWRGDVANGGGDGIGDVDDVNNKEQQLLRFFAGCELLSIQKPEVKNEEPLPKIEPKQEDVVTAPEQSEELVFYVFYPNNYSGVDDDPSGIVRPMSYLINGVGANKMLDNNKIVDYGTDLNIRHFGYEMNGSGNGISTKNVKNQTNITSGTPLISGYNGVDIAYQYCQTNKVGKKNYWGYRCDKAYENQVLHTVSGDTKYNYYDIKDYGLNSNIGFQQLISAHKSDEQLYFDGKLFSFTDVFCAVQPEAKNILNSNQYDEENINIISEILGVNKEGYTIKGIEVQGFASSHGYKSSNNTLGKNRAESVVKWLKMHCSHLFKDVIHDKILSYKENKIGVELNSHDSNSFLAKVWRCSRVLIKINKNSISTISEKIDDPTTPIPSGETKTTADNITYSDNKTFKYIRQAVSFAEISKEIYGDALQNAYISAFGKSMTSTQAHATINQVEQNRAEAEAKAMNANKEGNAINIYGDGKIGYANEYKFFSELSSNEPFLHSKIIEKLKYFDPAFHSITPEGFQSRLTFLHQCTRQGNTSAASDTNNKTRNASNLAFGRPPICVLRIGDFYNTKIIIDSLSINYDDTTWDLNDEGIGVMPMMANVNISFKFLGGSDLSGPINRLQNALSFNHYANTSVYDDRAEEIEYDSEGKIKNFKFNPK